MKKIIFILLIFITVGIAPNKKNKAKQVERKPNQEAPSIKIKTVFGDKTTIFSIIKTSAGARIDFYNNQSVHDSKDISSGNYEYLMERISPLSAPTSTHANCQRSYIELTNDVRKVTGCIGSTNKTTKELQDITNLVAILF